MTPRNHGQFGSRLGFMESGGQDVDGIVENLDNSISFGVLSGVDMKLLPVWLAVYGNPIKGLMAFQSKLMRKRQETGSKGAQNDFFSKCEALREKDPEGYEKFRKGQVMFANLGAGSGTLQVFFVLFPLYRFFSLDQRARFSSSRC